MIDYRKLSTKDGFRNDKKKRTVTIMGDSMVNNVKAHKLKKRMNSNERVYVKAFPGATTEDMCDYVRPSLKRNPDLIVLHVGTNNLRSESPAKRIAEDIIKLALNMKSNTNDVMVSGIVDRSDDVKLSAKALQVNDILNEECKMHSLHYICNKNIDSGKHLNGGGLHFNHIGTAIFAKNLLESINI